jgi:aryl-phospho-beta-D-glucosidase BglC (GH1 family)
VFHPMRRSRRLFGLDHRLWRSASRASRRRRTSNPLSQVPAEVSLLEQRCLMSGDLWATSSVGTQDRDGGTHIKIHGDFSFSRASNSQNLIPNGYFFTKGNQIEVSSTQNGPGTPVRIAAVNWTGFQKTDQSPDGLWGGARNYTSMMNQMMALGFNTIRLPVSSDILDDKEPAKNIDYNNGSNGDLKGLSGLKVLEKIVDYAGKIGMKIILDQHQQQPQESFPPYDDPRTREELWYDKNTKYTPQAWANFWTTLATDFQNSPAIIDVDLHNEPHGAATWGEGNNNPDEPTDWLLAAEQGGNAVLKIDPNWLVFVEGVQFYKGKGEGWGTNLMGVKTQPVVLNVPNRVVYSPHAYEFADPSKDGVVVPDLINDAWGYIYQDNIAPVFVGEFALSKNSTPKQDAWYKDFVNYLATTKGNSSQSGDQGISWGYFGFTPNSGDTQGVLTDNYNDANSKVVDELRKIET